MKLSTYDVERKYLCYTGNSNDKLFPDEISKYVDANNIEELHTLVEQIEQDKDTTLTSEASLKFCRKIARCKQYLSENSRTEKLLIQYIHYINIVKQFIRAGRTGNCQNYLKVVRQILNLFSATTHFQYAKSARLYLKLMMNHQLIIHGCIICFSRDNIQLEDLNLCLALYYYARVIVKLEKTQTRNSAVLRCL